MTLEIAVFNIGSALLAAAAGADRIELCENPADGGTTPSYGTLKMVREKISIPVFPIIRPRGGDFLYTGLEFEIMKKEVALCRQLGFEGVVLGLLQEDGRIDKKRTGILVNLAYPMEVTFHRAFDRAINPFEAMDDIIDTGCRRILTSGQVPNAADATALIKELVTKADNRISIMPGSGIRSSNIQAIARETGVTELHSSARKLIPSLMQYHQASMQETLDMVTVDMEEIENMKAILEQMGTTLS